MINVYLCLPKVVGSPGTCACVRFGHLSTNSTLLCWVPLLTSFKLACQTVKQHIGGEGICCVNDIMVTREVAGVTGSNWG